MTRLLFAFLLLAGGVAVAAPDEDRHEATQWVMGTALRVVTPTAVDPEVVQDAVAAARALEDLLSTWRDDTPLAAFNALPAGPHAVDPALVDYLERAVRDHERTLGAFDPSVGTLRVDPDAALGMDLLDIDGTAVARPHAEFAIDPGGDGKGLAVDAMVAVLRDAGVPSALIDFGGSSWFGLGRASSETSWRVAVRHEDLILGDVTLADRALSVSSTVQVEAAPDGRVLRRHHLIDPRTRQPVTADRTVAVLAATAVEAEVVSTALAVDGLDAARAWLPEFPGVEIVVIEDREVVVSGPSFRPLR